MKLSSRSARVGLLLLPLVLGAAGSPADEVVAQRGDVKLTIGQVRDMLEHADPTQRAQVEANPGALADFIRDRLLREILLAEAHTDKWDEKPDVVARANDARDNVIVQTFLTSRTPIDPAYPSQAEINAAYEANKARFMVPKQYHAAQIAILVPANATKEADEAAHRKAQDLRKQAMKPKADFADLARKSSQDRGTADKGGDMGWLREDQFVPAVRSVVANLPDDAISEPVRIDDGWHVIKMLDIKPAAPLSLDKVRDALVQALRQARAQQLARKYVEDMLRKEPIQLNEIDLARRISAGR